MKYCAKYDNDGKLIASCPNFDIARGKCNLGKKLIYDMETRCWESQEECIMFAQDDETREIK